MKLRYLVDTNIISEPTRSIPTLSVIRNLKIYSDEIAICSIVWHELVFGIGLLPTSKKKDALTRYLNQVVGPELPILPYDEKAAHWHASERVRLHKQGAAAPFSDGQIAAIAYTNNLTLVTRNNKDYRMFQGLKIENWFEV